MYIYMLYVIHICIYMFYTHTHIYIYPLFHPLQAEARFQVKVEALEETLDRFARFFSEPLLTKDPEGLCVMSYAALSMNR